MSRSPLQNDLDGMEQDAPSGAIDGDGEPDIPAGVGQGSGRERRCVVLIVVILLVVPSVIAAWKWFRSTRTDAYQFRRVDAEASALVRDLEGMEVADRWIALSALSRDVGEALARASDIGKPYYRIHTLSLLTATLAKAGDFGDAEAAGRQLSELARELEDSVPGMPDSQQKVTSLEAIALALTKAGLAEPARAVATRARDEALRIPDAFVRSGTLGSLASKCAAWGQIDLSRSIVLKIEDPGQRSSKMAELVPILIRSGQVDQAKEVALQATEAATRIPDAQARSASLSLAAPVLARAGLFDQAQDIALRLEHPLSRWSSLHSVAVIFLEQGHSALARDAAIRIREAVSAFPTPVGRWDMLRRITEILVKTGSLDQARETALMALAAVFQIKDSPSEQVTCLGGTARILAEVGLSEPAGEIAQSAREIARKIEDPGTQTAAWTALIGPMATLQAVDQAREVARSAEEAALRIPNPFARTTALTRIVSTLGKNGLTAIARDLASRIPDPQPRYDALSSLLSVEIDAGSIDRAKRMVRQVEDSASRIDNSMDRSTAFSQTVETLIRLDSVDEARRVAKMIIVPPDRSAALAKVAKALARRNRLREAREVAETCDLPTDRLDAFTTIVGEYTKMSKPELVKLIDELEAQPVARGRPGS